MNPKIPSINDDIINHQRLSEIVIILVNIITTAICETMVDPIDFYIKNYALSLKYDKKLSIIKLLFLKNNDV